MSRQTDRLVALALGAALAASLVSGVVRDARAEENFTANSSFERFATHWMNELTAEAERQLAQKRLLRPASNTARKGVQYKTVSKGYHTRLKETGKKAAPYVGILTYTEELYQCSGPAATDCKLIESSPITEIFPYTEGRWQY